MMLPRLLLITGVARMRPTFMTALEAALRGGARLIQLREKNRAPQEIMALALETQCLCAIYGAQLLINSQADLARTVGAAGVHWPEQSLNSPANVSRHGGDHSGGGPPCPQAAPPPDDGVGLWRLRAQRPAPTVSVHASFLLPNYLNRPAGSLTEDGLRLNGFSIHSVEAAQRAVVAGASYLTFGPVFPTATHPGTPPVGLDALRAVVEAVKIPVFAIGGIDATSTQSCLDVGAHGVAVISAIWQAPNIEAATRQLVVAIEQGK